MRLDPDFLALSTACGRNPLLIQGPGGNSSLKFGGRMWIKASGTELADAETREIFIQVDRSLALAEVDGAGDGTCRAAVVGPSTDLRPSIETTFHAVLDWPVVFHTHSVAALVHAASPEGRIAARDKLSGLDAELVPYRKPGLTLSRAIRDQIGAETKVLLLENHGLIVAGSSVAEVAERMDRVEVRLALRKRAARPALPVIDPPAGYRWFENATSIAVDPRLADFATRGAYFPDHTVFLGPGLPTEPGGPFPAVLVPGVGVAVKRDAPRAHRAILTCLAEVLARIPEGWTLEPLGADAVAELLNWDAEKHRRGLAAEEGGYAARARN